MCDTHLKATGRHLHMIWDHNVICNRHKWTRPRLASQPSNTVTGGLLCEACLKQLRTYKKTVRNRWIRKFETLINLIEIFFTSWRNSIQCIAIGWITDAVGAVIFGCMRPTFSQRSVGLSSDRILLRATIDSWLAAHLLWFSAFHVATSHQQIHYRRPRPMCRYRISQAHAN